MVYCVCGGDIWQMSGTADGGGAFMRRVFCCLLGDFGLDMGLESEEGRDLRAEVGLGSVPPSGATPSSGSGPRVDPPLAELTPDMAEMESPLLVLDLARLCCICW